jgi:hypothetical protein
MSMRSHRTIQSMYSVRSELSSASIEGMIGRQPIVPRLVRLENEEKVDVLRTPFMSAPRTLHMNKASQARIRRVQKVIIICFMLFYVASLGMVYLPANFPIGDVKALGTTMGIAETTSSIWAGILASKIGARATLKLCGTIGMVMIFVLYQWRDMLLAEGNPLGLVIFYIGFTGWGGALMCVFLFAENESPPEYLG